MHPHANWCPTRSHCCWAFHCGVMAKFVDAPDPAEAEGSELFVEEGAFRRHRWSEELFQRCFLVCPESEHAWGSTSLMNAELRITPTTKVRPVMASGLRRRRWSRRSRGGGGGAGAHGRQQGGNWREIGEWCCKTTLSVDVESFQNMKRQRGEVKKRSWYEPRREKENCIGNNASRNSWLLSVVFLCQWHLPLMLELHHEWYWYAQ